MDTTKEYIDMCEKAVEIQKLHIIKPADFVVWTFSREDGVLTIGGSESDLSLEGHYRLPDDFEEEYIWLPRQDQLFDIIKLRWMIVQTIDNNYKGFFYKGYEQDSYGRAIPLFQCEYNTVERTLLALVMKSNYNKTWNGKEWINEE